MFLKKNLFYNFTMALKKSNIRRIKLPSKYKFKSILINNKIKNIKM